MAAYKCIIVLTPNGRRQSVKVTPNTTLLQVLEEACAKHGFNSKDYDLKHHQKIMNLDNVIRFTGLPNNALLEMVAAVKVRQDTEVFLGVQIESGERFTGKFMPSESLWSLLNTLCPEEIAKDGNPVAVYMRTEISGRSNLENATLRSLGITGGRAMLRFMHRSPEELRTQANISAPLTRPISKQKDESLVDECIDREVADTGSSSSATKQSEKKETLPAGTNEDAKDRSPLHNERTAVENQPMDASVVSEPMEEEVILPSAIHETEEDKSKSLKGKEEMAKINAVSDIEGEEPMDITDGKKGKPINKEIVKSCPLQEKHVPQVEEEIKLLPGERSGCVFSMDSPISSGGGKDFSKDLPDDFFEVTLEDARVMLRDLKRRRAQLEDAPLMTSALRKQNEMHFFSMPCVLRVLFPDRIVLQGCFVGGETVEDVKSFVRENLENSNHPFHLYLSPPKEVLRSECFLYEVDGFPTTLVYFAYDRTPSFDDSSRSSETTKKQYLQSSALSNVISQSSANKVAQISRGIASNASVAQSNSRDTLSISYASASSSQPSTSRGEMSAETGHSSARDSYSSKNIGQTTVDKVPRWFRTTK